MSQKYDFHVNELVSVIKKPLQNFMFSHLSMLFTTEKKKPSSQERGLHYQMVLVFHQFFKRLAINFQTVISSNLGVLLLNILFQIIQLECPQN